MPITHLLIVVSKLVGFVPALKFPTTLLPAFPPSLPSPTRPPLESASLTGTQGPSTSS